MDKGKLKKTDNIMAKGKLTKDRRYQGKRKTDKRQTITWPKGN
jgi:tmRNA-binding protein